MIYSLKHLIPNFKREFSDEFGIVEICSRNSRRRIKRQKPIFTDMEVKQELFKQSYANEFSLEQTNRIFQAWTTLSSQNQQV